MILITTYLLGEKVIDNLKKCLEWFDIILLWDNKKRQSLQNKFYLFNIIKLKNIWNFKRMKKKIRRTKTETRIFYNN